MPSGARPNPAHNRPPARLPAWQNDAALSAGTGLFFFAILWFSLVRQLSAEWTVNPQYTYGWIVPFMCLLLAFRRWQDRPATEASPPPTGFGIIFICLLLLLLPIRLVQEANPDWRLVSWIAAIDVVCLTLAATRAIFGWRALAHFTFPICFILVAVPWPTPAEQALIQNLTRANAALTVETLSLLGIPAIQHGNLIEISTGIVGIDEACSGIRSFQANLMISLFLGELYRLRWTRRATLVAAGFALAFVFNVARTLILSTVAAKRGLIAISQWHDPAGVTILVACFLAVWLLALALQRRQVGIDETTLQKTPPAPASATHPRLKPNLRHLRMAGLAMLAWLAVVEITTQAWYRSGETSTSSPQTWSLKLPRDAYDFRETPIPATTRQYLRYTEASDASWRSGQTRWQAIFLRWKPGRTTAQLSRAHTPDICLSAAGRKVTRLPGVHRELVGSLELPFQVFEVQEAGGIHYVFYCLWEDRLAGETAEGTALTFASRWQSVADRRRNLGQRSLEIVLTGLRDITAAESELKAGLARLVTVP